jgi:hypothetical protein
MQRLGGDAGRSQTVAAGTVDHDEMTEHGARDGALVQCQAVAARVQEYRLDIRHVVEGVGRDRTARLELHDLEAGAAGQRVG